MYHYVYCAYTHWVQLHPTLPGDDFIEYMARTVGYDKTELVSFLSTQRWFTPSTQESVCLHVPSQGSET